MYLLSLSLTCEAKCSLHPLITTHIQGYCASLSLYNPLQNSVHTQISLGCGCVNHLSLQTCSYSHEEVQTWQVEATGHIRFVVSLFSQTCCQSMYVHESSQQCTLRPPMERCAVRDVHQHNTPPGKPGWLGVLAPQGLNNVINNNSYTFPVRRLGVYRNPGL